MMRAWGGGCEGHQNVSASCPVHTGTPCAQSYLDVPPKEVAKDKDIEFLQEVVEGSLWVVRGIDAAILTVRALREGFPQLRVVQSQELPRVIHGLKWEVFEWEPTGGCEWCTHKCV